MQNHRDNNYKNKDIKSMRKQKSEMPQKNT